MTVDRQSPNYRFNATPGRIERLERQIAETRMTAALETDWDQLHHRSRSIIKQFTQDQDPTQQIATACQIRTTLVQSDDRAGLRALRLATAAPMAGWLQDQSARRAAQLLGQLLEADQRDAVPGLSRLEDNLEKAQRRPR